MDLDEILDMEDDDFEKWLAQERETSEQHFKEVLSKACKEAPEVFKGRPLTRKDLEDARQAVMATPNVAKPAPMFVTEGELRALREKRRRQNA